MYYTIYSSCSNQLFTQDDLVDLLKKARANNEMLGVTGILLYSRGTFIQMLEGEKQTVTDLFNTIHKDTRHKLVFTLADGERDNRQFPTWSMAFRDLDSPEIQQLPGFSNFINEGHDSAYYSRDPMAALELLYMFRDVVR